jgi:hypothetical protein
MSLYLLNIDGRTEDIELSELLLSTITVEAKITNVNFKEYILINHILSMVHKQNENEDNIFFTINNTDLNEYVPLNEDAFNNFKLNKNFVKIGCNYGEYISKEYIDLTTVVKKSNRGRKKKEKKVTTRKIQGNGKYFNSQITFTVIDKYDNNKFYHVKLFTNGTIQIPCVCNEDIHSIAYIIEDIIDIINTFKFVKANQELNIEISYIKSIMRNYKFATQNIDLFIDLKKFQKVILNFKSYIDNGFVTADNIIDEIDENLYKEHYEELTKLTLTLVKHSSERYVGFLIKFKTPIESNLNKTSTVKIFSSGKFNLDGCNCKDQAYIIQKILYILMGISKNYIFYFKN